MPLRRRVASFAVVLLAALPAAAQDAVPALGDLVGARAAGAETEMESRGYQFLRTEEAGGAKYGYWRESKTGKCVTVRTAEGRYESIVYAPEADCGAEPQAARPAGDLRPIKCRFAGKDETCRVAIAFSQAATGIDVHFPDGFVRKFNYDHHGKFFGNDGMTYTAEHHDGKWIVKNDNRERFVIPKKWLQ